MWLFMINYQVVEACLYNSVLSSLNMVFFQDLRMKIVTMFSKKKSEILMVLILCASGPVGTDIAVNDISASKQ